MTESRDLFETISGVRLSDDVQARLKSLKSSKLVEALDLLDGAIHLECDLYLVLDTDISDDKKVVESREIVRGVAIKLASWKKPSRRKMK